MATQKPAKKRVLRRKKRLFPIDGEKLLRILWDQGCHSLASQAEALGTNEKRLRAALDGGSFQQSTILRWCKKLGIDPNDLLLDSAVIGRNGKWDDEQPVAGDWQVGEQLTRWVEATNGLQFRIFKMSHRYMTDGRLARGKVFDLSGFKDDDRADFVRLLERHPRVCQEIGLHRNIAGNLTALPDVNGRDWWVIDRWVSGQTLKQALVAEPLAPGILPVVMRGIAEGLAVLHKHGYLRRELSPRFVILEDGTKNPVLTDFELAKLLVGGPTVADESDWHHVADPYRAPEVSARSPTLGPQIDVYSWGRIAIHAAIGEMPAADSEAEVAAINSLPKMIRGLVSACVAIDRAKRPASMEEVLVGIRRWA
jgi:serine/threonine protein kinase